ncbi:ABC transporter ATP-binding protein [Ottowia testudinis]|uniref:ABC transporter ATP-binding protein n=1 Tax=Ottowia testudinis TaxID=2816950 RepID=A0A975CGK2_9BURK|nr:ABC transporter ATP-binding protein [Ottowia testudinis]QTD46010.1 ABC transporter ATP-binding protein [Ottowia testudinis]
MDILDIDDLHVAYGGIQALRGVSLRIAPGETVMVTGPNGAGKSTLMKALAGLVKPRQGRILMGGRTVIGQPPERIASMGLSMVPEGRHVFGSMSVLENLRVGCGLRRDKQRVEADLEHLLDVFPMLRDRAHAQAGLLSGGQQQMLVIARALMTRPQLLAIDEPSLGLAPKVTDQVYESLLRIQAERELSLLIVEQSSARVVMMGARMVMLRSGRVVLEGRAKDLSPNAIQQAYFGL